MNGPKVKLPDLMASTTKYLNKALKQSFKLSQRNERGSIERAFKKPDETGPSIIRKSHDGTTGLYKRYKKSQHIHDFGNNEHSLPSSSLLNRINPPTTRSPPNEPAFKQKTIININDFIGIKDSKQNSSISTNRLALLSESFKNNTRYFSRRPRMIKDPSEGMLVRGSQMQTTSEFQRIELDETVMSSVHQANFSPHSNLQVISNMSAEKKAEVKSPKRGLEKRDIITPQTSNQQPNNPNF